MARRGFSSSVFLTIHPLLPPRACAHAEWLLPLWEPQHSVGASPCEAPSQLAGVERPLLPGARTGLVVTPIDSSLPSLSMQCCGLTGEWLWWGVSSQPGCSGLSPRVYEGVMSVPKGQAGHAHSRQPRTSPSLVEDPFSIPWCPPASLRH